MATKGMLPVWSEMDHSQKKHSGASKLLPEQPGTGSIHPDVSCPVLWPGDSQIVSPAVLMTRGVIWEHSTIKRPAKCRYFHASFPPPVWTGLKIALGHLSDVSIWIGLWQMV